MDDAQVYATGLGVRLSGTRSVEVVIEIDRGKQSGGKKRDEKYYDRFAQYLHAVSRLRLTRWS